MSGAEIAAVLRSVAAGRSARALARAVGAKRPDTILRLLAGEGADVEPLARARIAIRLGLPWDALIGPQGGEVWRARLSRGLDLRELAARANVDVLTIRRAELGHSRPATVQHLLTVLE